MRAVIMALTLCLLIACGEKKNDLDVGQTLYNNNCKSCHGANGNLNLNGAKDLSVTKLAYSEIKAQMVTGKGLMPSFKKILKEDEMNAICTYVKSFSKNNK